jgi:hypothetical protein
MCSLPGDVLLANVFVVPSIHVVIYCSLTRACAARHDCRLSRHGVHVTICPLAVVVAMRKSFTRNRNTNRNSIASPTINIITWNITLESPFSLTNLCHLVAFLNIYLHDRVSVSSLTHICISLLLIAEVRKRLCNTSATPLRAKRVPQISQPFQAKRQRLCDVSFRNLSL